MRTLNLYSFHRNLVPHRFDNHNTRFLISELDKRYAVIWINLDGADLFHYRNDSDLLIDQGSILIFEFDDTKEFKTFDFGDAPTLSVQLSKSKNFRGAAIGQYNSVLWDETIQDKELRKQVKPCIYPESHWHFGLENYEEVKKFRQSFNLNKNLYWRGSIYKDPNRVEFNRRLAIEYVFGKLKEFHFGHTPLPFFVSIRIPFFVLIPWGSWTQFHLWASIFELPKVLMHKKNSRSCSISWLWS